MQQMSLYFCAWRAVRLLFVLVGLSCSSAAFSQNLLLTGATVHTVTGQTFAPGDVLIKDGKIAAVGRNLAPDGATTVDLKGLHIYPGMIELNSVLGLIEIGAVRATSDTTEVGEFTPDVESWVAVNPDSELIPVSRANGVAYFEPVPLGGMVSGQSGLVAVEGWTTEQRTIRKPIALHVFWPSMDLDVTPKEKSHARSKWKPLDEQAKERRAKVRSLEDFFEEAKAYAKANETAAGGKSPSPEKIPAWEAMLPYVTGKLPLMVHADEIREIKAAVSWAATNHYNIILAGARDAWMAADLLASNKIPVLYVHIFTQPVRDTEPYDIHFRAPEILRKAGVKVAFCNGIGTMDAALSKNLPYYAAQAMAFGFPADEALKGVTLYPAQIAGVADRLGSIEAGKEATVFVADGDILDIRTHVKRMWLAGKEISLENRHTRLYEKYKNRPKASGD